jgi:hypothetical protein
MNDRPTPPRPAPANADERPSASLLVRCWLEPSATGDGKPALRGYVKNLRTGEEMFIKDLGAVGEEIRRSLEAGASRPGVQQPDSQGLFRNRT